MTCATGNGTTRPRHGRAHSPATPSGPGEALETGDERRAAAGLPVRRGPWRRRRGGGGCWGTQLCRRHRRPSRPSASGEISGPAKTRSRTLRFIKRVISLGQGEGSCGERPGLYLGGPHKVRFFTLQRRRPRIVPQTTHRFLPTARRASEPTPIVVVRRRQWSGVVSEESRCRPYLTLSHTHSLLHYTVFLSIASTYTHRSAFPLCAPPSLKRVPTVGPFPRRFRARFTNDR